MWKTWSSRLGEKRIGSTASSQSAARRGREGSKGVGCVGVFGGGGGPSQRPSPMRAIWVAGGAVHQQRCNRRAASAFPAH